MNFKRKAFARSERQEGNYLESLNFQRKKITGKFYQIWYENEGIYQTDLQNKRNRKMSLLVNLSPSGNLRWFNFSRKVNGRGGKFRKTG